MQNLEVGQHAVPAVATATPVVATVTSVTKDADADARMYKASKKRPSHHHHHHHEKGHHHHHAKGNAGSSSKQDEQRLDNLYDYYEDKKDKHDIGSWQGSQSNYTVTRDLQDMTLDEWLRSVKLSGSLPALTFFIFFFSGL